MDNDIDFTDQELEDAQEMFFRNCHDAAIRLANVSSDNLSQMQLKAAIDGNEVDRFILIQAKEAARKNQGEQK